jgi:dolichyl-diphosphooligosaccharide--protein glycosyltransferase
MPARTVARPSPDAPTARPARLATAMLVVALVVAAFVLRTALVRSEVLADDGVRFAAGDTWYHVRLVENLVAHFPRPITFDPYAVFPDGAEVSVAPLLDWLAAAAALVAGAGRPSPRTVEVVCATLPAILGALTIVPAYSIGRRLGDRRAGLLAAGLLAVAPGQFLSRSMLGYADHHVAETLLATVTVALLLAAVAEPAPSRRRLLGFGAGAGAALGAYLLSWIGGSLFVAVLVAWALAQLVVDHLRGRSPRVSAGATFAMLAVALGVVLLLGAAVPTRRFHLAAVAGGLVAIAAVAGVALLATRRGWSRGVFAAAVVAVAVAGAGVAALVAPDLVAAVGRQLGRFGADASQRTIAEATPLLRPRGAWTLRPAWEQLGPAFFAAPLALVARVPRAARGDRASLLVIVWSGLVLAATLAQNRFGYYCAVNASILAGLVGSVAIGWCLARGGGGDTWFVRVATRGAGPVVVCLALAGPALARSWAVAGDAMTVPADWWETLTWMRASTPEPFGDPDAYHDAYAAPAPGGAYAYPDTAYGVMNWWDSGYWITRLARRIPCANPGQRGAPAAARFYLAGDELEAVERLQRLGARYVVVDGTLPFMPAGGGVSGKFPALVQWAGRSTDEFFQRVAWRDAGGTRRQAIVYHPAYYRSMLVRLYVFRGRAATPGAVSVITYGPADAAGRRVVEGVVTLGDAEQARVFMAGRPPGSAAVVGTDPLATCVPLEPVRTLRLVHRSPTRVGTLGGERVSLVEVWELGGGGR